MPRLDGSTSTEGTEKPQHGDDPSSPAPSRPGGHVGEARDGRVDEGKRHLAQARQPFDELLEKTPAVPGLTYEVASEGGVAGVWCREYGLAPERPFPAAVNDAQAAYAGLLARGYTRVALAGDSAGGGLALALLSIVEVLLDDSTRYADRVEESGGTCQCMSGKAWCTFYLPACCGGTARRGFADRGAAVFGGCVRGRCSGSGRRQRTAGAGELEFDAGDDPERFLE
ncbi:MAG: alpha/beta hydrolase fold domain-containing protein [Caldimonas sp.]